MEDRFDNNNTIESEEELIMDPSVSEPSDEFLSKLEEEVVRTYDDQNSGNNLLGRLFMNIKQKLLLSGGIILVLFTALVGGGYMLYSQRYGFDEKDILARIAENNQGVTTNAKDSFMRSSSDGATLESMSSSLSMIWREPGFHSSKTTYTPGKAESKCQIYGYGSSYGVSGQSFTVESRSFSSDSQFSSLDVVRTSDGEIVSFYLSNDEGYYEYNGGDYAVFQSRSNDDVVWMMEERDGALDTGSDQIEVLEGSDEVSIMPIDLPKPDLDDVPAEQPAVDERPVGDMPTDPGDLISQFFGEGAKVIRKGRFDGRSAYLIEYSSQTNCDTELRGDVAVSSRSDSKLMTGNLTTMITRTWVDDEDFTYLESSWYVGSVKDSNLVASEKYEVEKDVNASWDQVKDQFKFLSGIEVRELQTSDTDFVELTNQWVKDNDLKIIAPTDFNELLTSGLSVNEVYDSHYREVNAYRYDRKFYLLGKIGDALFTMNQPWDGGDHVSSMASIYLMDRSSDRYLDVTYFKGYSIERILKDYYGSSEKGETNEIIVDGRTISGNSIEFRMIEEASPEQFVDPDLGVLRGEGTSSSLGSDVVAPDDVITDMDRLSDHRQVIFEFDGYIVVVSTNGIIPALRTLDLNDPQQMGIYTEAINREKTRF